MFQLQQRVCYHSKITHAFLTCIFILSTQRAVAQSIFIPNGKTSISINSNMPVAFAGGAVVAADTLRVDTLYMAGSFSGYYTMKRALTVGDVTMLTGGTDTTELMLRSGLRIGSNHTFNAGNVSGLTLLSDSSQTACIEALTGGSSISGIVTQQRFIPGGKRAFRMISHPFNTAQSLAGTLLDDIDITGTGGAANGFTPTASNNPSAFWFDAAVGDTQIVLLNPGWTAFPDANNATWQPYQSLNVMVRGSKGQGLNGQTYIPDAVTLDMSGTVNQGNISIPVYVGPGNTKLPTPHSFNIIGNPYPSHINLKRALNALPNKRGSAYFVWNPNIALNYSNQNNMMAYGKYQTLLYLDEYSLPSAASFCIDVNAPGNLVFFESDKTDQQSTDLFKTTTSTELLEFEVYSDTGKYFWDNMYVLFDAAASDSFDNYDGAKFLGSGVNLFGLTLDGIPVSAYGGVYGAGKVIPLGFQCTENREFEFRVSRYTIDPSKQVFLHDNYLNVTTLLAPGVSYKFLTNAGSASTGSRFQLGIGTTTVNSLSAAVATQWSVYPNPAASVLTLRSTHALQHDATIMLLNMQGMVIHTEAMARGDFARDLDVSQLNAGVYQLVVTTTSGSRINLRFVKQ